MNRTTIPFTPRLFLSGGMVVAALVATVGILPPHTNAMLNQISTQLQVGSSGPDVTTLQTLLALNHTIYPQGRVTGYFGPLTRDAVAQFQVNYGLPPIGRVGPRTLAKVNGLIGANASELDIDGPAISSVVATTTRTGATFTWTSSESAIGKVYYDTTPITMLETSAPMTQPSVSGAAIMDNGFVTSHALSLQNLLSGTTYYFATVTTDPPGNVTVTLPGSFTTQP